MKVNYIYNIVESNEDGSYKIILATTSKRQAKVVLHNLNEAILESSNLRVDVYEVGSYLSVEEYDEELEHWTWYTTYSVEKHPIVKQGYKSSLIEDKIKSLRSK